VIALIRENGHEVFVNPDLIETAAREPDAARTFVVLTTGNTLVVRDDGPAIVEKIVAFRRRYATANSS
jgi:uncharacterized protein YlzI (FlbEa/FlbD family)